MAYKILFITDLHLRASKPVSRLDDDFAATLLAKIAQVRDMSEDADVVIMGGDIFDRPDAPHSVVIRAMREFKKFKIPVYTIVGNHDVYGYQGTTVGSTALGELFESGAVERLDFMEIPATKAGKPVRIYGLHAFNDTKWAVPAADDNECRILIAHKMLTDKPIPNTECHLVSDVAKLTNAHLVLSGDIHYPHNTVVNGIPFINPGSLGRLSIVDRDRVPQAAIITFDDYGNMELDIEPLKTRPSESLFNLKDYSNRMASEMHTKNFIKTYAQVVVSIKAEAHKIGDVLGNFLKENNIPGDVQITVNEYYNRAEKEILQEIKE